MMVWYGKIFLDEFFRSESCVEEKYLVKGVCYYEIIEYGMYEDQKWYTNFTCKLLFNNRMSGNI